MRFRFCGDGDCPDWVLTEITSLARMTSIKMKLLSQIVAKSLAGEPLDHEKAKKLTSDAKFEDADVKACVAALRWLQGSAARHGVDAESFSSELQQLGLPREHAQAVAKVHADTLEATSAHLRTSSLRVSRLESVSCRVESAPVATQAQVKLNLSVLDGLNNSITSHDIIMSPAQTKILLADLRRAKSLMEDLEQVQANQ